MVELMRTSLFLTLRLLFRLTRDMQLLLTLSFHRYQCCFLDVVILEESIKDQSKVLTIRNYNGIILMEGEMVSVRNRHSVRRCGISKAALRIVED